MAEIVVTRNPQDLFEQSLTEGNWGDAEAIARRQLARSDGDAQAHAWAVLALARCALARGDADGVRRWLDRAARIATPDADFCDHRASLLLEAGDIAEALALFERSAADDPAARLTTGTGLALALWQSGRNEAATQLVTALLHRHLLSSSGPLCSLADKIAAALGLPGWIGHQGGGILIGALRSDLPPLADIVLRRDADAPDLAVSMAAFCQRFVTAPSVSFYARFALPVAADRSPGSWSLLVAGEALLGSGLGLAQARRIEGMVELEGNRLHGWASCPDDIGVQPEIRLVDAQRKIVTIAATRRDSESGDERSTFSIDLAADGTLAHGRIQILAGPQLEPLAGSPIHWQDAGALAGGLAALAGWLSDGGNPPPALTSEIGQDLARAISHRTNPILPPPQRAPGTATATRRMVDVVIPVYGGRDETLACLDRVLARKAAIADVVVIDDATPDAELAASLDALHRKGVIRLLRNGDNQGFPSAANRGMALHPDRDVVLLNADALVSGDWLERLQDAAYASPDTGTVTALSNDATICSYPSRDMRDPTAVPPIPSAAECAALDRTASDVNAGQRVELPTAIGFCMYIRRDCLDETGLFSEDLFGRGYGEENDFCLRARRLGWRHVAAADVYVGHIGGASFGAQAKLLRQRNLRILETLHPGYQKLIAAFVAADPLAPARRRLDLARWRSRADDPTILLISLDLEGGAARSVEERRRHLSERGWRVLLLVPVQSEAATSSARRCRLVDPQQPGLRDLVFETEAEIAALTELLADSSVTEIEIHHSLNHHPLVLELPRRLAVPYEVVIHDYHWLCPQITLVGVTGRYCGEPQPSLPHCETCRLALGAKNGEEITVAALRRRSAELLAGARRVVAPSDDVAQRFRRYFPGLTPTVEAWDAVVPPTDARRVGGARLRVCVIGAIGPEKGHAVLRACAEDAAARDLPLEFVLVGYSSDDAALFATGRVFVTGRYKEEEALALVHRQDAHLAFVPSVCPETWCYAVSLAWQAGLQVAAFDLGAPAERIRAAGGGTILPVDLAPAGINNALLGLSGKFVRDQSPIPLGRTAHTEAPISAALSASKQIVATPQEMVLAPGFYAITVLRGGGREQSGQMLLPAIQVTTPPARAAEVEILSSHTGGWLTGPGDTILLKVGSETPILLTSYKSSLYPEESLEIQFTRVDGTAFTASSATMLPKATIVAHLQNLGDQTFQSGGWVGAIGQNLSIEGFGIAPEGGIADEEIEYKGVVANGLETQWLPGGVLCGTRGQGIPLIGLAIRLRGHAAERYDSVCEAVFLGGSRSGPKKGGAVCRSDVIGAPLEGFLLSFVPRN